jgi:uncharacterized protein (DUF169 family)
MRTSRDMLLNGENISCPAAKGTLGSTRSERCAVGECLKEFVKEGMFLSEEAAFRALMGIARMGRRPRYILISTHTTSPDAYVFHLSPKDFMLIAQAYQRIEGEELGLDVSSIMPVCVNCASRPYVTDRICASFGCADSRTYGVIADDKFVVEMPVEKAVSVARSLTDMMNIRGG